MTDAILIVPPAVSRYHFPEANSDRLGVAYLAAALEEKGYAVDVIHCGLDGLSAGQAAQAALSQRPALVGLSVLFADSELASAIEIARLIKVDRPQTCVVMGGHPITLIAEPVVGRFDVLDAVVRGEGERVLPDLVDRVMRHRSWQDLPGVVYRHSTHGQVVSNPLDPLLQDLDTLPFPRRNPSRLQVAEACVDLLSSRGCHGTCSFCSIHGFTRLAPGKRWRARCPQKVVDEIERLQRDFGVRRFTFIDDNFIGPGRLGKARAADIARELIRRKIFISFAIECRADDVDLELFQLLKCAGLGTVLLGIESGVPRALQFFKKATTVDINKRALDVVNRLGLELGVGFILFDPFTTPEEVRENLDFLRQAGLLDDINVLHRLYNALRVFPGTPVARTLGEAGLLAPCNAVGLEDFPIGYTFRFVDPRARLLYDFAERIQVELSERLWARKVWGEKRQHYLAALPVDEAAQHELRVNLEAAFSFETERRWIADQGRLALNAFETLVEALIARPALEQAQAEHQEAQTLAAMEALDRQLLGEPFRARFARLENLLSPAPGEQRVFGGRYD